VDRDSANYLAPLAPPCPYVNVVHDLADLDALVAALKDGIRQAVELLRQIDPSFSLYVASDTLCLMKGPSHDDRARPLKDNVVESTSSLRISGGDW
jgi:hypothetical protein